MPTLITLSQSVKRSDPAGPLVTLSQSVKRQYPAATLATLSQSVKRSDPAGEMVRLEQSVIYLPIDDWDALAPAERQTVYVIDVGSLRVPISSAQATMRRDGQSFLQAVVPSAGAYVDDIAAAINQPMALRKGYRYADGSLSPLEPIAEAPFQISSRATGAVNDTLTISGYGTYKRLTEGTRDLVDVQTRTTGTDGLRRVRAAIDLFLRPGHTARDTDGREMTVGVIQYFINAVSEGMEMIEEFVPQPFTITFDTAEWQTYLAGDWVVDTSGDFIASAIITHNQNSALALEVPYLANITVFYKVRSEAGYDFFQILVNGAVEFSDSGDKSATWLNTTVQAGPTDTVTLRYIKDFSVSELDDRAYIQKIDVVPQ